jgi:bifunctional DNA-binding transcriptional regulator/antitoxin component of YhaV-PrlF toxin-antitoxin module
MDPSEKPILGLGSTEDPLTLRVGSRGRLTIPPQALEALGWKHGDTLLMTLDEQGHLIAQKQM